MSMKVAESEPDMINKINTELCKSSVLLCTQKKIDVKH